MASAGSFGARTPDPACRAGSCLDRGVAMKTWLRQIVRRSRPTARRGPRRAALGIEYLEIRTVPVTTPFTLGTLAGLGETAGVFVINETSDVALPRATVGSVVQADNFQN